MNRTAQIIAGTALAIVFLSCATVRDESGPADYLREVQRSQRALVNTPDDPRVLSDLGVAYFKLGEYEQAKQQLHRAFILKPNDPRTMFYYGLSLEYLRQNESALAIYTNYLDGSDESPFRTLAEGRYRVLLRSVIRSQILATIANEKRLSPARMSASAVAVLPLRYQGSDERYAPLSKGISEMIMIDLGHVKSLRLVERIRTEELLKEIAFGQSAAVDPATAPRMGLLLRAGQVVAGAFNISQGELLLDVAAWDVVNKRYPEPKTRSDDLDNLFKIQKEIVFGILKDLGITPTAEERQQIEYIPTRSFLAFMNYCLGLQSEDAFDFIAAGVYYKQATELDPNFEIAQKKLQAIAAVKLAGGSKEQAFAEASRLDVPPPPDPLRLVRIRLGHLSGGLGQTFLPGDDSREPAEESYRGGAGVQRLPDPPPPPR